jgi:hypothetical protein
MLQVEEVREAWIRRQRRSVVLTAVLGWGGEGQTDGAVPRRFDVEEK